jgi:acyl carrier protein
VLLEREYKISLNETDLAKFKDIASIVELVIERLQPAAEIVHA